MKKIILILNILLISNSFGSTGNESFVNWKIASSRNFSFSPVDCLQKDQKLKVRCTRGEVERVVIADVLALSSRHKIIKVKNAEELTVALNRARGGEVIVLTNNIDNFRYYRKHQRAIVSKKNSIATKLGKALIPELKEYSKRVYLIGRLDNGQAPFISHASFSHIKNLLISHIKTSAFSLKGSKHAWQILNSEEVRLSNILFNGPTRPSATNNYQDVSRTKVNGLLVSESRNIVIDRCMFQYLFHAVQFRSVDGFLALSNKADHISSDMFSGGGLIHAVFDSNLSLTKYPFGKIHSDMIQLSTKFVANKQKFKVASVNRDISIRNNVSLQGSSPVWHRGFMGWQCFFTRDEVGDKNPNDKRNFSNIKIYNNICVSTQHHGITLSRGHNNTISNNLILKLDLRNQGSQKITASITAYQNSKLVLMRNISGRVQLDRSTFYGTKNRARNITNDFCFREHLAKKGECNKGPLRNEHADYITQQNIGLKRFLSKGEQVRRHLLIERDFNESLRNITGVGFGHFGYIPASD